MSQKWGTCVQRVNIKKQQTIDLDMSRVIVLYETVPNGYACVVLRVLRELERLVIQTWYLIKRAKIMAI